MPYAREFFQLQLGFVQKAAALMGRPWPELLLSHSNFYIRFGSGRDFNPDHPVWRAYLRGLQTHADALDWTWRYYLSRAHVPSGPATLASFGCFSYALDADAGIRLHFSHRDPEGPSLLGRAQVAERRAELAILFAHLRQTHPEIRSVSGMSWLYQLEAYRRLFPAAYVASAQVMPARFHSMSLWGQFLNRKGEVRQDLAEAFGTRVAQLQRPEQLADCFPFQVLAVSAPVAVFYTDFGIVPIARSEAARA